MTAREIDEFIALLFTKLMSQAYNDIKEKATDGDEQYYLETILAIQFFNAVFVRWKEANRGSLKPLKRLKNDFKKALDVLSEMYGEA